MTDRHTQKREPAKGCRHRSGQIGIVCYFDEETFATVRQRAVDDSTSFGEQIRLLVEWGLETAEIGALDPDTLSNATRRTLAGEQTGTPEA